MSKTQNRVIWVDLARILAICLMMMYHLCGKGMWWATTEQYQISYFCMEYRVLIFFHLVSRICIPMVLMVSGMFMLEPQKQGNLKYLYRHNILRILLSLMVWNAVYTLHRTVKEAYHGKEFFSAWKGYFTETHYHLIFLYSLTGIYVLVPVLRIFAKYADEQIWRYLLTCCLVGICVLPTLQMIDYRSCENIFKYLARFFPAFISASSGIGYAVYCMLGYYIKNHNISIRTTKWITMAAVAAGAVEVVGKPFYPEKIASLGYYDIGTIFTSAAVVLWIRKIFEHPSDRIQKFLGRRQNIIYALSKWSFGAYLVHDFILQYFIDSRSYLLVRYPLQMLAMDEVIVVIASFAVSALLNQIPFVRKYFV